jgi:hypothetical protein
LRYFASGLFGILIAMSVTGVALADYGYAFSIPATLTNLSAGSVATALCNLYAGPNGSGNLLANQQSSQPVRVSGSYAGTFTVSASSSTKPGTYKCWIAITGPYTLFATYNIQNGNPSSPQTGWTGTMVTTANLP